MSSRDVAFVALGRFLVVERYYEAHQTWSSSPPPSRGPERTGDHAGEPDARSGRDPTGPRVSR